MFDVILAALILTIGPFTGPPPEAAASNTARFSVTVAGRAWQEVRLRALGVPSGYIASFCTPRVCAPFRVSLTLPKSGRATIELQLIENVRGARKPTKVTVAADGAPTVSLALPRQS